jgi:hypothetical protein
MNMNEPRCVWLWPRFRRPMPSFPMRTKQQRWMGCKTKPLSGWTERFDADDASEPGPIPCRFRASCSFCHLPSPSLQFSRSVQFLGHPGTTSRQTPDAAPPANFRLTHAVVQDSGQILYVIGTSRKRKFYLPILAGETNS